MLGLPAPGSIVGVAAFARPSNSTAAAPMILRNRPVAKPANSEPVSRRPAAPQAAAPLMACRPFEAWQRVRREFGSARQRSHTSCVDNRAVFANPTTCFSSEDGWRGPCASTDRDRRLRLLQALVRHSPANHRSLSPRTCRPPGRFPILPRTTAPQISRQHRYVGQVEHSVITQIRTKPIPSRVIRSKEWYVY